MAVVFERLKNRSLKDYYKQIIQPRQAVLLTDALQKTGVAAKREHTYQNRTGALETSIRWQPAKILPAAVQGEISAGGPSTARWAFDVTARRVEHRRRRNRRAGRNLKAGGAVYVNYAGFVENKKYTVLTAFVKQNLPLFRKALGPKVRVERV